jgi:hypothetical protein
MIPYYYPGFVFLPLYVECLAYKESILTWWSVVWLYLPGLEPTIYRTREELAYNYTSDAKLPYITLCIYLKLKTHYFLGIICRKKKRLKTPKGYSESVNRRTGNAMANKIKDKEGPKDAWLTEEFKDTRLIIRIRKSKKDRQHNGQWKHYSRTPLCTMHIWWIIN